MAACCFLPVLFLGLWGRNMPILVSLNQVEKGEDGGMVGWRNGGSMDTQCGGEWIELVVGAVAFNELVNVVAAPLYNAITQSMVTLHLTNF